MIDASADDIDDLIDGILNDAGLDNPACPDGWFSKDKCYTCPDGILSVNNNVCECSDGSACVETPLKNSRDDDDDDDDFDDFDDDDCFFDDDDDYCDDDDGDGVICINGVCYTCANGAGIYFNNGTCACTDGSACVEAPLKNSRDAIETTDDLDDLVNCDDGDCNDDSGSDGGDDGVVCINGKCYTCPNDAGIYVTNGTCECADGSACVEASPAIQAAEADFDIED